jgi:5'-nucleotidase
VNILLTNDDGIHAPGLCSLYEALSEKHKVWVVAPDGERSAVGHAITLSDPLRVKRIPGISSRINKSLAWAVSGTPADCVKIGVSELIKAPIDLVISGINLGPNVGINVLYSGTVSAATEGAILGIRSIAVSIDSYKKTDFCFAAQFMHNMASVPDKLQLNRNLALNVNIPALSPDLIKGVKITRQDTSSCKEFFEKRVDPRGNIYYWQASQKCLRKEDEELDTVALRNGYISITPIHYDLTSHECLEVLRKNMTIELP